MLRLIRRTLIASRLVQDKSNCGATRSRQMVEVYTENKAISVLVGRLHTLPIAPFDAISQIGSLWITCGISGRGPVLLTPLRITAPE
jgi:hypothetical protein